ncbi:hypothetical protein JCM15519_03160 [Fundidesulfovibrio butyratiphilus]
MSSPIASPVRTASPVVLALSVLLAALLAGCVEKSAPKPEAAPQPVAVIDTMDTGSAYAQGVRAFWESDYGTAATIFENLLRRQEDESFRSQALYGLACARLASADTAAQLREARETWQDWERINAGDGVRVDPHMLTPFIQNPKIGHITKEMRQMAPATQPPRDTDCLKRLQDKEREVSNLQKQIKALEAIHREIQQKKRMTAP